MPSPFQKRKRNTGAAPVRGVSKFVEEDNRLLLPDCTTPMQFVTGKTILRLIPEINQETGDWVEPINPTVVDGDWDGDVLGDMFVRAEVQRELGPNRLTFISGTGDDKEDEDGRSPSWSPASSIMWKLRYKLEELKILISYGQPVPDACRPWVSWLTERQGDMSWLTGNPGRVYPTYMVQGYCRMLNGEALPDWQYGVYALPKSAMEGFLHGCRRVRDTTQPLGIYNNQLGDFCSPESGFEMTFEKAAKGNRYIHDSHGTPVPIAIDSLKAAWKPWDTLLFEPDVQGIVDLLSQAFDPAAIAFACREAGKSFLEYVPAETMALIAGMPDAEDTRVLEERLKHASTKAARAEAPTPTPGAAPGAAAYAPPASPVGVPMAAPAMAPPMAPPPAAAPAMAPPMAPPPMAAPAMAPPMAPPPMASPAAADGQVDVAPGDAEAYSKFLGNVQGVQAGGQQ